MAVGLNNAIAEGQEIGDSDFKIGGSRFFEIGWAWKTRVFEESNWLRLKYGISFQFNGLKPTENRYFVENEVLFDTNTDLHRRFLNPGPFSKFYLQLDAESPDRIGWYIGWQIVRKYMEDNDVSTRQLLIMDSEHIFNKANYKPAK